MTGPEPVAAMLARLRRDAGLTQREVADRLCQVSGSPTVTRHEVSRWERGLRIPTGWLPGLARVLRTDLASLEAAVRLARSRAASIPERSTRGGESDEVEVRRRELLRLLGTGAFVPVAGRSETIRGTFNASCSAAATDLDCDVWERLAYDYAHEVGSLPADQVLPNLLCDLDELNGLIGAVAGPARLRLHHAGAQLATLTAITLTHLGAGHEARRWWRTAARGADQSGDRALASAVRGRQAVFALYEDRAPVSILAVAEEAIHLGDNRPTLGVISGHAAKAQILGQLRRHEEARAALHDVTDLFDRLPDTIREDRSSQWGWSAQRLHHVTSHVHTFSGSLKLAGDAQDAALASYPAGNYQGRSQIEIYRAGSLLRSGDVQEGSRHLVSVLTGLPADRRRDGLLRRTAVTALSLAPPAAAGHPGTLKASELLALTAGDG